ncbi:helix-turn-helix domain-containing protein [Mycobacterium sp. pUA109]|uniref:helix-turn-helix domain-containing protein n=1 Tax=Mycobacterium sp. pUA109 TaxID=3238982 RepID=UPI00351B6C3E
MDEVMSGPEVAEHLGVSERRVRAIIADGQLPAQRLMGRWAIPAQAVAAYKAKSAGRPMSEQSAWSVMNHLANGNKLQSRMEFRLRKMNPDSAPQQLRSWLAARGKPMRAWAFKPALEELQDDHRVVVSGDNAIADLEPIGRLCVYASAADVDDLAADYELRRVEDRRKLPNAVVWVVENLGAVPRNPHDKHNAAEIVAAIDLLDDGDPRAVGVASDIIGRALEGQQ